ncbi:hypothetical protein LINGRAHAP2_LOCUS25717 [Linum grandiflorum]
MNSSHLTLPLAPPSMAQTTNHDNNFNYLDDDDDEDTLSLSNLPLHSTNVDRALDDFSNDDDDNEEFEFSREYLMTSSRAYSHDNVYNNVVTSNNGIVFCGKLINSRQSIEQKQSIVPKQSNEKQRIRRRRFFPWKSSSSSSTSSSSSSTESLSCRKSEKKSKSGGMGYLCMGIGVEWKFPVRSMDVKEIKMRQSRRRSSFSNVVDEGDDDVRIRSPEMGAAGGKKSGNGVWGLIGILAGGRR